MLVFALAHPDSTFFRHVEAFPGSTSEYNQEIPQTNTADKPIAPCTKLRISCLVEGHNTVPSLRLELSTPRSQVEIFTTEPLWHSVSLRLQTIYA